jgi:molecular chaperone GrpE
MVARTIASRAFLAAYGRILHKELAGPSIPVATRYLPSLATTTPPPASTPRHIRWSSTGKDDVKQQEEAPPDDKNVAGEELPETPTEDGMAATEDNLAATEAANQAWADQVKELKDALLRSLAEQENTRRIAARDVSEARQFAIKSFAKSLLDVSDNLERAMAAVPSSYIENKEEHPVLANLYEGIELTERGLMKAFTSNGLEKFGAVGEIFDPNQHEALMEYPDPTKVPGTIGQVMKVGFLLNKRVLRPAEVGVIKKVD